MIGVLGGGAVFGQSTDEINSVVQFNFSNPGARSLAMGGAFTARADDATAVYANPAGLTQLSVFEFALEGRGHEFTSPFLSGGTAALPGGFVEGGVIEESTTQTAGLSFGSLMYPGSSERWTVGGFRHEALNYETELFTNGVGSTSTPHGPQIRPISAKLAANVVSWGLSAAGKLYQSADKTRSFSIGITASYDSFELSSRTERMDKLRGFPDGPEIGTQPEPTAGITEFDRRCCQFENRGDVQTYTVQTGSDEQISYGAGLLWNAKRYSIGVVYRQGAEFEFQGNEFFRFVVATDPFATIFRREFLSVTNAPGGPGPWKGVFKVPDVYGMGVSVKPHERLLLSIDYNRIEYSDLVATNLDIVGRDIGQGLAGESPDHVIDDGDEYRLGLEFMIPWKTRNAWFLRAGAWSDPAHDMRYIGTDLENSAIYLPSDDEIHVSGGVGLRLPTFQVEVAADASERVNTVSLSGIFYLDRD